MSLWIYYWQAAFWYFNKWTCTAEKYGRWTNYERNTVNHGNYFVTKFMIWFNKIFFILLIFIFLARKTTTWLIILYLRRGMEKRNVMGGGAGRWLDQYFPPKLVFSLAYLLAEEGFAVYSCKRIISLVKLAVVSMQEKCFVKKSERIVRKMKNVI